MLEASFLNLSDRSAEDVAVSVGPAWEVREDGGVTAWHPVRLDFPDGARLEVLAVVSDGCVSLEDVRARPALSLVDLAELADWIEGPLSEVCGTPDNRSGVGGPEGGPVTGARRARPPWPRGPEGRWLIAREYRAAQEEGTDPVLAVMRATGHSRRGSLRLIAQARDAGYLPPRHARR